jgi:hypothetical protein
MPIIGVAHEAVDLKVLAVPLACPARWSAEGCHVIPRQHRTHRAWLEAREPSRGEDLTGRRSLWFAEHRMDGLADAPRSGAPRKITDEQVEVVVTRVLTEKGRGQDTHWSTRSMADETGLSQSSVSRTWRAFGLKPHVVET